MGKTDIVKSLSKRIYGDVSEFNIKQASQFCDMLVDVITEALIEDKKVLWKGFLSIEVIDRDARRGRHPQTNEVVTFPPSKSIKCKISQSIKDIISES